VALQLSWSSYEINLHDYCCVGGSFAFLYVAHNDYYHIVRLLCPLFLNTCLSSYAMFGKKLFDNKNKSEIIFAVVQTSFSNIVFKTQCFFGYCSIATHTRADTHTHVRAHVHAYMRTGTYMRAHMYT
jgi:hypothetical protein